MHHESGPFSIPAIKSFVPEKLKPWIIIFFVIIFQLSGGVYIAAVSEMTGSLALLQEDIMMAGYASLAGMSLTFAIMFRLKFRFSAKSAFLTCGIVIIAGNIICMNTGSVPVLVGVSFVTGIFRMWATFECNSTIQLWLTPKRDLSVFFCYIYLLVQGCMQMSGLISVYTSFFTQWQYMHYLVIVLLCLVLVLTMILFNGGDNMKRLPLYGIDWLGALLWGLIMLCIIFICVYGDYYDWFESRYIRFAAVAGGIMLLLNLWRASFIRHPYIPLATFRFKIVYVTFLLYIVVDILLAPSHILEHIYLESVLGYDSLNFISLNWVVLSGIVAGSVFTFYTFAVKKWSYRLMTLIAFLSIAAYLVFFYFNIDYNLSGETVILPLFLRSFGYVIISICFITFLSRVPFQYFFQSVSVQAFVSAAIGAPLGSAVLQYLLKVVVKKNMMLYGSALDNMNIQAAGMPFNRLFGELQLQALMVSMKEIYGYMAIAAIFCILLFMIRESDIKPKYVIHPTYHAIRKLIRREMNETADIV